jgi:hypothetical protein
MRSNGYSANGRLQKVNSARTVRAEVRAAPEGAPDSEQSLSGAPSDCQSSNGQTLTVGSRGWRTGLSGAPIDRQPPQRPFWWVGL